MLHESPSTPDLRGQPRALQEEDHGAGHHDPVIEDRDVSNGFGKEREVADFSSRYLHVRSKAD